MEIKDVINNMAQFLQTYYDEEVEKVKANQLKVIEVDYSLLAQYDPVLAELLLDEPDDFLKASQLAVFYFYEKEVYMANLGNWVTTPYLVNQVTQVNQLNQVTQPYTFPSNIVSNSDRILWLLTLVKETTAKEICDFLKISKSVVSMVFSRPERQTGLVTQGWVTTWVTENMGNRTTKYAITDDGKAYLERLTKRISPEIQGGDFHTEVMCRFFNLPASSRVSIGDVRVRHLGKFVSLEAVVRRKSDVRPQAVSARFECPACGNLVSVIQTENTFKEPNRCSCGRKGKFRMLSKELMDMQHLVVEDLGLNIDLTQEVKRQHCILSRDLCDKQKDMLVGNRVLLVGQLKEIQKETQGIKTISYDIVLDVNSIKNLDDKSIQLSAEDWQIIHKYANEQNYNVLSDLASKFAPHIAGNEHIKQALILQLVSQDIVGFKSRLRIHLHIAGTFGAAKTQMAKFSYQLAHKSVFADGTKASSVGLTASVIRDDFLKSWVLEAGVIAIAGKGLAFIDEVEKQKEEEISAISEPMENGTITVAKANLHQTLPGPARILSCGNFSPDYTSGELAYDALNLKGHVVDRFDFIFRAAHVNDEVLAQKILLNDSTADPTQVEFMSKNLFAAFNHKLDVSVSPEVYIILNELWKKVRQDMKDTKIKFSPRFLESLRRLAVASAKLRFSNVVEPFDAKTAVALATLSLYDRGFYQNLGNMGDTDQVFNERLGR